MLRASLYITWCTARNRLRVRLRRLREPRYLVGSIVGVAYLYLTIFARGRSRPGAIAGRRGPARAPFDLSPAWLAAGTSLAGLAVFLAAAAAWLLPMKSSLLEFSSAETAFLFPAPVSRRQLLAHRMLRSQLGSLFAAVVIAILLSPLSGAGRLRFALGTWVFFVTVRVYFAAVVLTRARFSSPDPAVRRAVWLPVTIALAALGIVASAVGRPFVRQGAAGLGDLAVRLARTTATGPAAVILWPFMAVLRPQFASGLAPFAVAMAGLLAVLAATVAWMAANDGAFELVVGEAAGRSLEESPSRASAPRARTAGWTLALHGRPEGLFVWKSAMQTLRPINIGLVRVAAPAVAALVGVTGLTMAANRLRGPAGFASTFAAALAGMAVLFGPQMMRLDMRGDLAHLDLLKTWPVRAGAVIRGEMLWPATVVSVCAWLGIVCAALLSGTAFPEVPFTERWAVAVAALLIAPALVAAQYAVHNAIAVWFPAWISIGRQRTRGVDAMGQRLITLAAILASLLVFALPGALAGGLFWFVLQRILGAAALVPAAAIFTAIVLMEVLVATELLGPAYERLDMLSIERTD